MSRNQSLITHSNYTEADIRSLDWREHIRTRPGMYVGRLGDGSQEDDGIYLLFKEVLDNSIDEFLMGVGDRIKVEVEPRSILVRDFGRGIPHGKLVECLAKINTGGKYDTGAFYRSVGLNGIGTKAVNALSTKLVVESIRDGYLKRAEFSRGHLIKEAPRRPTRAKSGTRTIFEPDLEIFKDFRYDLRFIKERLWSYAFLNRGLKLILNGEAIASRRGLLDLLEKEIGGTGRYPVIHQQGEAIEYSLTHTDRYGESYRSFVNGQYTPDGGTHQAAFREGVLKALREYLNRLVDPADARGGIVAAILVRIHEPVFESQTKTKLGSTLVEPSGPTIRSWVVDYVRDTLVRAIHKTPQLGEAIARKIEQNEKERRDLAGIRKLARERQKKATVHNKKLRDCKLHYNQPQKSGYDRTQLFITEGDSASGSLNAVRDVRTQAVFSLKGKPLNCFGLSKKVVYQNEELNLLQHALGIEDDLVDLRYNQVILATDADVDGMHIRLLLLTFFLQFFPELVRKGHLFILQTPLFRVRNQDTTRYCYTEEKRDRAMRALGQKHEVTRFKGLGEISPHEFSAFIGDRMRLDLVKVPAHFNITEVLQFYMGKNTPRRRQFILSKLLLEPLDVVKSPPRFD